MYFNRPENLVFMSMYGSYMNVDHTYREIRMVDSEEAREDLLTATPEDKRITYIKSNHGRSANRKALALKTLVNQEEVNHDAEILFHKVKLEAEGHRAEITFASVDTILVKGHGENVGLVIDNMPTGMIDNAVYLYDEAGDYVIFNSYKTHTKYLAYTNKGSIQLIQKNYGDEYSYNHAPLECYALVEPEDGEYQVVIQEIEHNAIPVVRVDYDFEQCAEDFLKAFETFYAKFDKPTPEWEGTYKVAVYSLWSAFNRKNSFLKRDLIGVGNEMVRAWSGDVGHLATGLAHFVPKLAFDQIMCFFDMQDEDGCIPGSMTDDVANWNLVKPPTQGYFLGNMWEELDLSRREKAEVYDKLSRYTYYMLRCKDFNHDGICEYHHGNESNLDNLPQFDGFVAIDSPDLTVYMIKNYELLSRIAKELGKTLESEQWRKRADETTKKALEYFVVDNRLVCRNSRTGEIIESQSYLPLIFLNLKERLPKELKNSLVETVKKDFVTDYGMPSEAMSSPFNTGHVCRGNSWYQTQMVVDALYDVGEVETAKKIAKGFCEAVRKSGCYETYDVHTGKGSLTAIPTTNCSTSGVFIHYYHKYIKE